jgi:glucose-6-phosphate dehydrogenase assembly protein OpcA
VNVADLEQQLSQFWREASTDDRAVMRACTHNLIVACEDDAAVVDATRTVALLSEEFPGRVLLVVTTAEETEGGAESSDLEAFVSTHCHRGASGNRVCCEQVTLAARGASGTRLVPDTVVQLLERDVPVYTWWRRRSLAADPLWEPFARISDRCIVNSATSGDPARGLADLATLASNDAWRGTAGDLAWVRIEPWREIVAALFDSALTRVYLEGISTVEIETGGTAGSGGTAAAGAYLVAWLASRLGWSLDERRGRWRRPDGTAVEVRLVPEPRTGSRLIAAVRIEASYLDRRAKLVAERTAPGEDLVRLRVETEHASPPPSVLKVRRPDDAPLLCGELERDADDNVFLEALDLAARWAAARERPA